MERADFTPLCIPDHWRLETVAGEHPGYLLSLLCRAGHVHFVAHTPLYGEAWRLARAWEAETLPVDAPPLPFDEGARGPS